VNPRAGLNDTEKIKFLTLPGLELRPIGRSARSQSLYRLPIVKNKYRIVTVTSTRDKEPGTSQLDVSATLPPSPRYVLDRRLGGTIQNPDIVSGRQILLLPFSSSPVTLLTSSGVDLRQTTFGSWLYS
jgi:hypothetical protein